MASKRTATTYNRKPLDLAETPFPYDGHQLKVIDGQRLTVMWLIRDSNLDLARAARQVVPLVLIAHCIEIRHKLDAAEEYIVSKIVGHAVALTFWLFCPQVALDREIRVSRNITIIIDLSNRQLLNIRNLLTSVLDTCKGACPIRRREG
jgi:hypothetical protein